MPVRVLWSFESCVSGICSKPSMSGPRDTGSARRSGPSSGGRTLPPPQTPRLARNSGGDTELSEPGQPKRGSGVLASRHRTPGCDRAHHIRRLARSTMASDPRRGGTGWARWGAPTRRFESSLFVDVSDADGELLRRVSYWISLPATRELRAWTKRRGRGPAHAFEPSGLGAAASSMAVMAPSRIQWKT